MDNYIKGKILLIDDELDIVIPLQIFLKQYGHEALIANSARRGLSILDSFDAEVVLTDLMMPEMTGFELLDTMRQERPLVPVMVISAYDSRPQILKSLQRGAYDFISKPFDFDLVHPAVIRALEYHALLVNRERQQQTEAVAALACAVAHELNQPLTVILGHIFLLQKDLKDLDDDIKQRMQQITASAEAMADIVQRLSKITRYETKHYIDTTALLDLNKTTDTNRQS